MNDKSLDRYFKLMGLIFAGFTGTLLIIVILFYTLKLFSIAMFNIPGSENVFHFFIVIIPYAIFFAGHYYMHTKIAEAKTKWSSIVARILMIAGSLICLLALMLDLLIFLKIKHPFLRDFNENSHYVLVIQIISLFATAAILASGDPKEKNWMERGS